MLMPRAVWWVTLAVTGLMLLTQIFGWKPELQYARGAILHGELWRLVTGQFVHLGWIHLALNLAGLWLWTALAGEHETSATYISALLAGLLGVGLGLLVLNPGVGWYVGLSGVLHGLFAHTGVRLLARRDWLAGGGVLAALTLKLMWEQTHGDIGTARLIGGSVVMDAHLYGAVAAGGVALIGVIFFGRR